MPRSGTTCPASNGTRRSLRAKAGTEVLCVHSDASNEFGRLPLLVTQTFGAGKVLFMGTDGAWRWRKGVEDKYHYRFWGQVVRWMAYQRNMAKGETMRLYYSPDQPQLGNTVTLNANVMERTRRAACQGRRLRADRRALGPGANDSVYIARRRMGRVHRPVHLGRAGPAQCDAFLPADGRDARSLVLRARRGKGAGRPAGPPRGAGRDRPRNTRQSDCPTERFRNFGRLCGVCPNRRRSNGDCRFGATRSQRLWSCPCLACFGWLARRWG